MRLLLLWCLLALAVVARAEDGGSPVAPAGVEDEDVDVLENVDEEEYSRIDFARALGDLFEFTDNDAAELHDEEEGIFSEARAMNEESALEMKAKIEPEDQARYNKFMDTFFRRLNADARSSIDPLDVALIKRKTKKAAKKSGPKKGSSNKKAVNKKKKNKKSQKKGNNKKSKNKKTKKTSRRDPKSLNLDDVDEDEDESANEEVAVAEEDSHHIVAREAEEFEEIEEEDEEEENGLERQERSATVPVEDEDVDESAAAVTRRKGKPQSGKKKSGKKNKKNKGKGGKRKGGNKKKKGKSKTKRSASKKNDKKKKKRSPPKTSRAAVSGIATLSRVGDVSVADHKEGKVLKTAFKVGPVTLKVNRKFGSGKKAIVRSATASSPELTGKMNLYVAANGKAKITKFNIARPSVVTTSGTLSKDQNKRAGNNNFMESSISRIVPTAAKKLMLAARDVLQATESKN